MVFRPVSSAQLSCQSISRSDRTRGEHSAVPGRGRFEGLNAEG